MVIFTRTYDFVTWLIPITLGFPRAHRFVVTQRLQAAALNFQERLIDANAARGRIRSEQLKTVVMAVVPRSKRWRGHYPGRATTVAI
jgi:hypothetical protein